MEYHQYVYISPTKVDLMYNQMHPNTFSEVATEASGTIGVISGKVSAKKNSDKSIFQKLEFITNELYGDNKIGRLNQAGMPYIIDTRRLILETIDDVAFWRNSWFDASSNTQYRLLMYGSSNNITGNVYDDKHFRSGSDMYHALRALLRARSLISSNNPNDGDQKWRAIEDIFALDGQFQWRDKLGFCISNQKFLMRVDYRETITIKDYDDYIDIPRISAHSSFSEDQERDYVFPVPQKVGRIVYVFGSPISIEKLPYPENVHIINGKRLLYISASDLQKKIEEAYNTWSLINDIISILSKNELKEEAYQFKNTMYPLENKLTKNECKQYIYEYITDVKPL